MKYWCDIPEAEKVFKVEELQNIQTLKDGLFYLLVVNVAHSLFGMFFTAFMFHYVMDSVIGLFFGLFICMCVFNTRTFTDCLNTFREDLLDSLTATSNLNSATVRAMQNLDSN